MRAQRVLILWLAVLPLLAQAAERPKLYKSADLTRINPDSLKVWVFFKGKTGAPDEPALSLKGKARLNARGDLTLAQEAERPVSPAYLHALEARGARIWQVSRWLNAASVWIEPQKLAAIENLSFVAGFRPVVAFKGRHEPVAEASPQTPETPQAPAYVDSYGSSLAQLEMLNLPLVHTLGYRGQGVTVAMLDDGFIKAHSAFTALFDSGQVLGERDFVKHDGNTSPEPGDVPGQGNHGTSTWSVVGGTVPGTYLGGAIKADFVLAKTEDDGSETKVEEDNWAAAVEWADSLGADVISSSLAYFTFDPPDTSYTFADLNGATAITSIAASMAADLGILVCNAAGNSGPGAGSIDAPADAFDILTCGAVTSTGTIASFSSRGPTADGRIKPELVAQGVATSVANPNNLAGFGTSNGTSFATPLIAAATAVLRSVHPEWNPRQVREALMLTAGNRLTPNNTFGWGLPDVFAAAQFRPDSSVALTVVPGGNASAGAGVYRIKTVLHNPRGFPFSAPQVFFRKISEPVFASLPLTAGLADTFQADIPVSAANDEIVYYAQILDSAARPATDPVFSPWLFRLLVDPARFSDNAELGPSNWRATGTGSTWGPSAVSSNSGKFSFSDSPRGNYANNADWRWEQRNGIAFNPATTYFLRYFEKYALAVGDTAWLEASTDGGLNWALLGAKKTGTQGSWSERLVSLGTYLGTADFRLRFRLKSDGSAVADGLNVDDVSILPRGDLNGDGLLTGPDVVLLINFVFLGVVPPVPAAAADMNGDLVYSSSDVVCSLNSVFLGTPCPAP